MAIIYSYSKTSEVYGSDLLVLSRFHNSASSDNGRNYSIEIDTLVDYLGNNYVNTLEQVLNAGNISTLSAKINGIYLYNNHSGSGNGYVYIDGSKNRFNFYNNVGDSYGYLAQDMLRLEDSTTPYTFGISKSSVSTGNYTATFQDKSGTVAYLSDISTTTNYGLASQISDSIPITNTTTESSLIGNIVGTLSVPADTFSIGDSFKASLMGHISCLSSATIQIRIKTSNGDLLVDTGVISLNAATAKHWDLEINFTIRNVGEPGIAEIISGGSFSYNKNGSNNPEAFNFINNNNSSFDTTVDNELVITAQWNNASLSNSIYSQLFTLNKVY